MDRGVWTLILVLGVAGFSLCFAEENGLYTGSIQSLKLGTLLIKTLFPSSPHKHMLCLCMTAGG